MLQKLNERIQGIIAWVIIILITFTFALFGVDYYLQSHQANQVAAEVNKQPITKQALELSYRRMHHLYESTQKQAISEKQLKKQILSELITNKISVQAAQRAGFSVSESLANAAILSIPQFQEDGHFSTARYQQALSSAFFTPETFLSEVQQGMLLNQQRFAFIGTAFALPSEVKHFVKLYMQTRDYQYLIVPVTQFLNQIKITDEMIAQYYEQHKQMFLQPEMISIDYVRLSMQDIMKQSQISDEQVKQYYDENQSHYLMPARWQVAHLLFALPESASETAKDELYQKAKNVYEQLQKDPTLFAKMVQKHSDDKLSVLNQGVLPWIEAGQSKTLDKALVQLTKAGQMTPPVKTKHGYEIYKLIAYTPAKNRPFSEVAPQIRQQLLIDEAQSQFARKLDELTDLSYQSPDSLNPIADALKLKIEHTNLFSRSDGDEKLTQNKQLIQSAFSQDVLELGNNSEPVQIDNDSVVVLRLKTRVPEAIKPLSSVRDQIKSIIALKNAKNLAKELGNKIQQAPQNAASQQLIEHNQLHWKDAKNVMRESTAIPHQVNEIAFKLSKTDAVLGQPLENGDYAVVRLVSVHKGKLSMLDKEQVASITQQLEASYGILDYDLYLNGLINDAKIIEH